MSVDQYEDEDLQEHVDYPHWPGQLYDCPACEEHCYCDGGETWVCVFCDQNG